MRARGARHPVGDLLHLSDQLLDAAVHQVEILSELILPMPLCKTDF
jgi:hypothetical protein